MNEPLASLLHTTRLAKFCGKMQGLGPYAVYNLGILFLTIHSRNFQESLRSRAEHALPITSNATTSK